MVEDRKLIDFPCPWLYNYKYVKKIFKSTQIKVIVWACVTGNRLDPLIVCDERGINTDEYEDIIYNSLFSLVNDLLEPP